jgi:hypothetical protein
LIDDILGEVAKQKEVVAIATSMKEAKNIKSFHSFQMISTKLTFPDSFSYIIEQLR